VRDELQPEPPLVRHLEDTSPHPADPVPQRLLGGRQADQATSIGIPSSDRCSRNRSRSGMRREEVDPRAAGSLRADLRWPPAPTPAFAWGRSGRVRGGQLVVHKLGGGGVAVTGVVFNEPMDEHTCEAAGRDLDLETGAALLAELTAAVRDSERLPARAVLAAGRLAGSEVAERVGGLPLDLVLAPTAG
jgi:hypothetical protein